MRQTRRSRGGLAWAVVGLGVVMCGVSVASAQTDVLYVVNNKVGIGTATPAYLVEVDATGVNSAVVTKRTDGATNFMNSTASYAQFGAVTNHPVRILVNSTWKMMLSGDNSLSMASGASCTVGGVWTDASSITLKENIRDLSAGEAFSTLEGLNPVRYNYKVDKGESHVGFIAEAVPDLVAMKDRKSLSPMDVVAVLTKVVQEQQRTIAELKAEVAELKQQR